MCLFLAASGIKEINSETARINFALFPSLGKMKHGFVYVYFFKEPGECLLIKTTGFIDPEVITVDTPTSLIQLCG